MYTDFAQYYDLMMADVDYSAWAGAIEKKLMERGIVPGMRVCECACGTGSLTIPLARSGYRMCGVDLSGDMLAIAMEKTRKKGLFVPYVQQDMAKLSLPSRQDAILCTCDGVNYLSAEDCGLFFRRAFSLLRPGGIFMFDVSTPRKLVKTLGSNTLHRLDEKYCYIWENSLSRDKKKLSIHLTAFVQRSPGIYVRFDENQVQFVHALEELESLLKAAGYTDIETADAALSGPAEANNMRWHLIAKHPEEVSCQY